MLCFNVRTLKSLPIGSKLLAFIRRQIKKHLISCYLIGSEKISDCMFTYIGLVKIKALNRQYSVKGFESSECAFHLLIHSMMRKSIGLIIQ